MRINPNAGKIVDAIFSQETVEINGQTFHRRMFKNNSVRGFDINGFRWIEQNPATSSIYAKMTREGAQIVWVIKMDTNEWKALIIDKMMHHKVAGMWQPCGRV